VSKTNEKAPLPIHADQAGANSRSGSKMAPARFASSATLSPGGGTLDFIPRTRRLGYSG